MQPVEHPTTTVEDRSNISDVPPEPVKSSFRNFCGGVADGAKKVYEYVIENILPVLLGLTMALTCIWMKEATFVLGLAVGFRWGEEVSNDITRIMGIWEKQNYFARAAMCVTAFWLAPYVWVLLPFASGAYLAANAVNDKKQYLFGYI